MTRALSQPDGDSSPHGWVLTTLGELGEKAGPIVLTGPFGTSIGRSDFRADGVPVVTISCLTDHGIRRDRALYVTESKASELARYRLRAGDILFSRMASVGRAGLVGSELDSALFNYHIMRVRLDQSRMLSSFFLYYVRGASSVRDYLLAVNHGATRNGVNTEQLLAMPVQVPPTTVQRLIVAEIEKHLTRLDAAVAVLRRVQGQLKRYRAAVVRAAFDGKLLPTEVELSRRDGRAVVVGTEVVRAILDERMRRQRTSRVQEPVPPNASPSRALPNGWAWSTLGACAEIKGGITKNQKRRPTGPSRVVPYLRVANVQRGFLDLSHVKTIEATEVEIAELALLPGDMLFNEGGDRDKLGRGWIWNGELPECIHQNHVFRGRVLLDAINPKFVSLYANAEGQSFFFEQGKHTTNMASISMSKLKALPIPVPPTAEQHRIVAEVERRFSVVEELEATVAANLQRAARLRQSILDRAFQGTLVRAAGV